VTLTELALYALLVVAGVMAGWLNTLAGGGSMLTVPALIWYGLPADVANGTSRIAILAQGFAAMAAFRRQKQLDVDLLRAVSLPSVIGAIVGAYVATLIPAKVFEPILIAALIIMAASMFARPEALTPKPGTPPLDPRQHKGAFLALCAAGFYGGFLQAGVGFVLLAVFAGVLKIDLVRANGLKVAVIFFYSIIVVLVFAARAHVDYVSGAVLAVGHVIGAEAGVRFAVRGGQQAIKKVLFVMIVASALSLLLR
jgi:uncharacterized membrane protein YfcA